MKPHIENRTPYAVLIRRGAVMPSGFSYQALTKPPPWGTQVVVKATFAFQEGMLQPAPEQLPVLELDRDGDEGFWENDAVFHKDGVDLVVLGEACAPGGGEVQSLPVTLTLGARTFPLLVTGDRRWVRQEGGWAASAPLPFSRMPLTYERAFGGTFHDQWELDHVFTRNPVGKGWTPNIEGFEFEGRPLPNVEDPAHAVTSPEQEPDPAGFAFYRLTWGLRLAAGVAGKDDGTPEVLPRLWNCAHPSLILPAYPKGQLLRLDGMHPGGPVGVAVPNLPVTLEYSAGGETRQLPAKPDLLCVMPTEGLVVVVARWLLSGPATDPPPYNLRLLPETLTREEV